MIETGRKHDWRREWAVWLAAGLTFCLLISLVLSAWFYALGARPWSGLLIKNFPYWFAAGLLIPAVIWFVRRVGSSRGRWPRAVALHVGGLGLFVALHALLTFELRNILQLNTVPLAHVLEWSRKFLSSALDGEILIYVVVLCAAVAHDRYRDLRAQREAARALELEQARLQAALSDARLDALRMQLQPHFLFNALHGISTLILRGDGDAANNMLTHLADFLRLTLDGTDAQEVPLARELEFLDAYLRIQKARFGERLQVVLDVAPPAAEALVPSLLLQPLVENAIRHGIGADPAGGMVTVRARVEGSRLHLAVEDDGRGLRGEATPREGRGLQNIRTRLEQLYPEAHSMVLVNASRGGAVAEIVIPLRRSASPGPADTGLPPVAR